MYGYFCTGFIDVMLKDQSLPDYANLFCPNDYDKNDKIILKYFNNYCVICGNYRKFEKPRISYLLEKNISSFYFLQQVQE